MNPSWKKLNKDLRIISRFIQMNAILFLYKVCWFFCFYFQIRFFITVLAVFRLAQQNDEQRTVLNDINHIT